jgi:hypothetical protein
VLVEIGSSLEESEAAESNVLLHVISHLEEVLCEVISSRPRKEGGHFNGIVLADLGVRRIREAGPCCNDHWV